MRVLHVVSVSFSLPYFIGDQFEFFKGKGVEFYVASSPSQHFADYSEEKGFIPWPIEIKRKIDIIGDLMAIFQLVKLIKRNKIDIVIGHTPKGGMVAMISASICRLNRKVYFRHGIMYETSSGIKRWLLKKVEQLSGNLADSVICVSNSIIEFSNKENLNFSRKNLLLGKGTCNGVNINRFNRDNLSSEEVEKMRRFHDIKQSDTVVGFVGRLCKDKGISDLIEAWKIVKKMEGLKLLLVGPFDERDILNQDIKEFILNEDSVVFIDFVKDTVLYYALMDVFVLPSYREGFPTVVLEASSMSLPIITTRSTGCKDSIVESFTGIFCSHEVSDIADKILYYLQNRDIARLHGKNGRDFVSHNFCEELIWEEIQTKVLGLKSD